MEQDYTVTWTAPLTSESHIEAARRALEILRDAFSEALTFTVEGDGTVVEVDLQTGESRVLETVRRDAAPEPYGCGNCDSPLGPADGAHAACEHGYMTGCADCGDPAGGGYSDPADPDSGPPCQRYVSELETGILAGNDTYSPEYLALKARWSDIRTFATLIPLA